MEPISTDLIRQIGGEIRRLFASGPLRVTLSSPRNADVTYRKALSSRVNTAFGSNSLPPNRRFMRT